MSSRKSQVTGYAIKCQGRAGYAKKFTEQGQVAKISAGQVKGY
jgi:hypothetical protein